MRALSFPIVQNDIQNHGPYNVYSRDYRLANICFFSSKSILITAVPSPQTVASQTDVSGTYVSGTDVFILIKTADS